MGINKKGYIESQSTLFGASDIVGFGDDDFCVREVSRDVANTLIVKNHYSKKFYNASYIHLGMYNSGALVGILQFGYAMNPASQEGVVANTAIDEYLELNRMWIDDAMPKNTASKAISYAVKYIKRKYPKIKWIQSFADERCHLYGVVYQASNFVYCGEHTSNFWILDGIWYHKSLMERNPKLSKSAAHLQRNRSRATTTAFRQFRYVYFISKKSKKDLMLKIKPYPKNNNAEQVSICETSGFQSEGAGAIPAFRSNNN